MRSMRIVHVGAYHVIIMHEFDSFVVTRLIRQFMQYTGSNIVMAYDIIKHL